MPLNTGWARSFEVRLLLILLAFILVPASLVGWMAYSYSIDRIRADRIKVVGRVADLRHEQLNMVFNRAVARSNAFLTDLLGRCGRTPMEGDCARKALQTFLRSEDAVGAILYSPGTESLRVGDVPFSMDDLKDFQGGQLARYSRRVAGAERAYLILAGNPGLDMRLGVVYPIRIIQPIFVPHSDLGLSGETFLTDEDGYFVTQARYDSTQGHSHPISARPMQRCLGEQDAETLDLDYRDVPIIHGFRFVRETGSGCIMAHIDQAEAFAPLAILRQQFVLVTLAFGILAVFVSMWMARRMVRPIRHLTEVVREITAGNLAVRADPKGRDEVALLAKSINAMTDQLAADRYLEANQARLEEEVSVRTADLERANAHLRAFTYAASHDLKAPLRGIISFSTLLERSCRDKLVGDELTFLDFIRKNATKMNTLIEDLLAHAQIEQHALAAEPIQLNSALRAVLNEREHDIRTRGVDVRLDVPDITVRGDSRGLVQVLANLLENALKFSSQRVNPVVEIGATVDADRCRLWVKDNGVGFDMAYRDTIFEIFRRLHTYEEFPGSGVGLALVKKALDRMGGRIWAEGATGQGATFFVELPLA